MADDAKVLFPDMGSLKAQAEAKREEARKNAHEFLQRDAERQARYARALYDAFMGAGFSEEQAFELTVETFISD